METNKTLILIPTYNEHENVVRIFEEINELKLNADILFLDDNSPDGTGEIIDELAERNPGLYVIHRSGKLGIGSAHLAGIRWAYENHYDILITMDCDFTHSPGDVMKFINYGEDYDVVVGSRYMEKDSLSDWNLFRKTLTYLGHFMTTKLLKMPYDATGAFRLYRLGRIPVGCFELVHSKGYSFFFESLHILHLNNHSIKEISIKLLARTYGHSKMSLRDAMHSLTHLIHVYLRTLIYTEAFIYSEPFIPNDIQDSVQQKNEWDAYWAVQKSTGGLMYDLAAVFYRKVFFKKALSFFVKKYFRRGARVLHAGCGSGQVDTDVSNVIDITALDITVSALNAYKKIHKDKCRIMHGSILEIPAEDKTYDGIYNLGVMEHFTEEEIQKILSEFNRVLKSQGKIILFWPFEFGLSVVFMKCVHYILNNVLKKNKKMHPDEITRVKSKKDIARILKKANFEMTEFYFGIKDFFTHAVIVARKHNEL